MNAHATLNCFVLALWVLVFSQSASAEAESAQRDPERIAAEYAENAFIDARARLGESRTAESLWKFARAAFDWAEFARTDRQREEIALPGIAAAREAVSLSPGLAAAHFYLGMNLGQLARTKRMAGLGIVREMEQVFQRARELDASFDFAGPDRNLGLLYLEAPGWPLSIGNRKKARQHLIKAVELAPDYPENRLNLIEACLRWNERITALNQLAALEARLPEAREQFKGPQWITAWIDWEKRLKEVRQSLTSPARSGRAK